MFFVPKPDLGKRRPNPLAAFISASFAIHFVWEKSTGHKTADKKLINCKLPHLPFLKHPGPHPHVTLSKVAPRVAL